MEQITVSGSIVDAHPKIIRQEHKIEAKIRVGYSPEAMQVMADAMMASGGNVAFTIQFDKLQGDLDGFHEQAETLPGAD